jgi:type VI secretion system protein ImpC
MSAPEKASSPAAATEQKADLLTDIISRTKPRNERDKANAKEYISILVNELVPLGQVVSKDAEATIKSLIAEIDKKLTAQLNEVMHAPEFQRLEATWRGLHYLVHQSETGETLKIRVLNVSKRQLFKDLERAVEFDQSALFKKVYEEEYGILGGKPFGMLVGDYEFDYGPEDIGMLRMIAGVAASAHAPFVAGVSAEMFGFDRYTELSGPRDLAKIFEGAAYAPWKSFRESDDSRYAALTLPRVLARYPYGKKFSKVDEFDFEENVDGRDHDKFLWMNAAWAYAARITDAFSKYGWMARSRGVLSGGKVENLPACPFKTDDGDVALKCPTEIGITDRRELELSTLGFLPLCYYKDRDFAVFMGAQSCQKPKTYFEADANANAELSAKFNYLLCVSRFAHYLKVMARDRIGQFTSEEHCKGWLNKWIKNYTITPTPGIAEKILAERPLSEARIDVKAVPGRPGWYEAIAYLKPHFQFEGISASLRLVAEVPQEGMGQ